MKVLFMLAALTVLSSCFSRCCAMSRDEFESIQLGDRIETIEDCAGEPYDMCSKGDDTFEYEYIEKITFTGKTDVLLNHYYITVSDGIIVGKRFKQESSPAYNLIYQEDPNSYSY